ncbi:clumping factor A-like [Cyclopterus lumpus]|uniref:clumping factor A-like n=1 Tax=Cyclopterus lumpus TaxID=8103 RepID=UPI001486DFB4|nr:clumping factor A-like [Cyclopterus lumpus]
MNRDQHMKEGYGDSNSEGDSDSDSDSDSNSNSSSNSSSEGDSDSDDVASIRDSDNQLSQGASCSQLVECDTVGMKRRRESSKCDQTVLTNIEKPQDCDEYYFMNLVKLFKKLSPQKKSVVRMKIERLLFEAEFE